MKNAPSISLFQSLGFVEDSRSDIFEEITYALVLSDDVRTHYLTQFKFDYEECSV